MLVRLMRKIILLFKLIRWRLQKHDISPRTDITFLTIRGKGNVCIGQNGGIRTGVIINLTNNAKVSIGDEVFINDRCLINAHKSISIGSRTIIGQNVCMYDHDHDYHHFEKMRDHYIVQPICIGEDVWIGSNVTILRGTEIGDRCVIGAGTVVKGIIPADSMVYTDRHLIMKPINQKENSL